MHDGKLANEIAISVEVLKVRIGPDLGTIPHGPGEPYGPNRFCLAAAARAGDPTHGDTEVSAAQVERPFGHLDDDRFTDGAMFLQSLILHAE